MKPASFLDYLTEGGGTLRYHTKRTLQPQTVGEHSFGVAWLCHYLTGGDPTALLLMAALDHDMPEFETGDIPAPVKREVEEVDVVLGMLEDRVREKHGMDNFYVRLTKEEQLVLKRADILEAMCYCLRELSLGNTRLRPTYYNYVRYLGTLPPCGRAESLARIIGARYDELDKQ